MRETFKRLLTGIFASLLLCQSPANADHKPPDWPESFQDQELVVRCYHNWRVRPCNGTMVPLHEVDIFETAVIKITEPDTSIQQLELLLGPADGSIAVVALAKDQISEPMKERIARGTRIALYDKELSVPRLILRSYYSIETQWLFTDALGKPIAGADVQVFLSDRINPTKLHLATRQTDKNGCINAPLVKEPFDKFYAIVSHADYGTALVNPTRFQTAERLQYTGYIGVRLPPLQIKLPLVKSGTRHADRALKITITDPDGDPVAGAFVYGQTDPRMPVRFRSALSDVPMGLTGAKGRVCLYPIMVPHPENPEIIRKKHKFSVMIYPPPKSGLLKYAGWTTNEQESRISLERGAAFKTFSFVDANGPITDERIIERISIATAPPENPTLGYFYFHPPYYYFDFKDGLVMSEGRYMARVPLDLDIKFEPVAVTQDGPQDIVFRANDHHHITFTGTVVHGVTGEPMPGTFMVLGNLYQRDISSVTTDQWRQLHSLQARIDPNDARLAALQRTTSSRPPNTLSHIMRTDENGRFSLDVSTKSGPKRLIAFEQDFLAVPYDLDRKDIFDTKGKKIYELPPMQLYPSATLLIEPRITGDIRRIIARLDYSDNSHLNWVEDFHNFRSSIGTSLMMNTDHRPNIVNRMQIPANVNFHLRIQCSGRSPEGRRSWCPILTRPINAAQGQTIDLDVFEIPPEIPIHVEVVDSQGRPLENIPVQHGEADTRRTFQGQITNETGLASFSTRPYYRAVFFVAWRDRNDEDRRHKLIYETKGPQDADNLYTLQLPDEVIEYIENR